LRHNATRARSATAELSSRKVRDVAVGEMRAVVIDVNDLGEGERFWSAVSGKELLFSGFNGQFSRLGRPEDGSILLQLVPEAKTGPKNRVHLDFTVEDVEAALQAVEELGGGVKKPPSMYPSDEHRVLEWAVALDPFGNEFCLIRGVGPADVTDFDSPPVSPS
jgi:hypothetical protein